MAGQLNWIVQQEAILESLFTSLVRSCLGGDSAFVWPGYSSYPIRMAKNWIGQAKVEASKSESEMCAMTDVMAAVTGISRCKREESVSVLRASAHSSWLVLPIK